MSVKVMGAVFDLDIPPNLKLVLLAYADHAHHDGTSIFPAADLVAEKTGYSVRSVKRIARELESAGLLIPDGRGPHGTRRWRIPIEGGVILSPLFPARGDIPDVGGVKSIDLGVSSDAPGVTPVSPEPSLDPSLKSSKNQARFSKNDQTPFALAMAMVANSFGSDLYTDPSPDFWRIFGPLQWIGLVDRDGARVVRLAHPDPNLIMEDDMLARPLLRAFASVLGPNLDVRIEKEE